MYQQAGGLVWFLFMEVPVGLEPQFGLLGVSSRLRSVPLGFSMVGGLGSLRIVGQAGLESNRP